jgi:hypothetical protein
MVRLALVATAIAACFACVPCGSYEVSGTLATDAEGNEYNGHWREQCGSFGAFGTWDLMGDGIAGITFMPDAPGERGWQGIDIEIEVGFPTTLLVPGTTLTTEDMGGGAFLTPCISCPQDGAGLTAGTIEVVSGWEGTDPCELDEGPPMRLRWDLTFGAEGGPLYELQGTDRVVFSTFTTPACSDVY